MEYSETLEILIGSAIIFAVLILFSVLRKEKSEGERFFVFWSIAIVSVFATAILIIDTVQENLASVTGGPVHWHADFEIYACGEEINLKDPSGLANRIGTPVLHEHGDKRIHVEGTVNRLSDVNLGNFFSVIGGELNNDKITIPTNSALTSYQNGDECADGEPSELQVFLYKTDKQSKTISQIKLDDFPEYVLSPESVIPPGDCLIFEFGPSKDKTERMCTFYKVALQNGDLLYESTN